MSATRREFLGTAGALAVTACGSPQLVDPSEIADASPFKFGVASGDPLQDRIIFWTALSDVNAASVPYTLSLYSDPELEISAGAPIVGSTEKRGDYHLVKTDISGLTAGTTYYYQFKAMGFKSPIGRTRTLPAVSDHIRLAICTCGDITRGYWNAYARLSEVEDIDAVVHLGDYIYETDNQDRVRPHNPPVECRSVDEYRGRYASYRSEAELQNVHRQHPMIWVWDDHETVDGLWRNGADPNDHSDEEDGAFGLRKAAALTAVLEWMPIRTQDPNDPEVIYRDFDFGGLVHLIMIDTRRIGRDAPGVGNTPAGGDFFTQTGVFADESRHILGETQQQWLFDRLSEDYPWRFLGNSVTFSQIKVSPGTEADGQSVYANPDQWDGYKAARDRVFDHIESNNIDNLVICTGDVHASLAAEVSRDPNNSSHYVAGTGMGSVATEFVTPSISSGGDPKDPDAEDPEGSGESIAEGQLGTILAASNPHSRYTQIGLNGYMIMDVTAQRVQAEYWHVPEVEQINDGLTNTINFVVNSGTAATSETQEPATGNRPNSPAFAP